MREAGVGRLSASGPPSAITLADTRPNGKSPCLITLYPGVSKLFDPGASDPVVAGAGGGSGDLACTDDYLAPFAGSQLSP